MSDTAIRVENLSKKYVLSHQQTGGSGSYNSLRDKITDGTKSLGKKLLKPAQKTSKPTREEFWALKDVSFEIKQGDRVGIIGRNGAGKSTLLKILSRIVEPTNGKISIKGRIASLLEVGTGFHPELTGRENVFLNGAILGMSKEDIKRNFDQIVAFAEVEKFLDTPVKRYSSGMYVRLAFAVAAHLEPEVLILDEVLAVGDSEFRKKCMQKMRDISEKEGRTVLFVSHDLGAIKTYCNKGIMLQRGQVYSEGDIDNVTSAYLSAAKTSNFRAVMRSNCGRFELKRPFWVNDKGQEVYEYAWGESYRLRFEFYFFEKVSRINPGFFLVDDEGRKVFTSHLLDDQQFKFTKPLSGKVIIDTDFNLPSLAPGEYQIVFGVRNESEHDAIFFDDELIQLKIVYLEPPKNGTGGMLWHTSKWLLVDENLTVSF
ncbi:ABC transporter ATP-binding protein [Brasilonema octagenarum UFV-E1]|uniref:ABC transporter ATP-binding protein n=1 Tax=Brasilonema sennae CENA114 TaxID=415709 RepID=A0A856MF35_9CYAN|nr:ABC transporter ATP-binding protein [Brasilonema sennae]QDL09318.1 ABC transporter ATP-binding protein [Brasilonema sennae CENA114]QDL15675.1 ABC transporter ATP-binding protein [Brasilonema octagenarum UFV-E1]